MNNQAAQTMPELPPSFARVHNDGYWTLRVRDTAEFIVHDSRQTPAQDVYSSGQMLAMYQQGYAAALSQTAGVAEGWMRDVADAAASLDKRGDRQMAARLMRLHRDMLAAAPAASGGVDYDEVWLLLKSAQTNIAACRPDWDADDAEHWDRLTAAMESVKAASIKQPGSINRPLVSDDSQNVAASVSERARAILKSEMGGFGTDTQGRIPLEYALRALEQALTQQRGECYCQSCKGSGEVIGLHASPSGDPQDAYEAPMACPKCDGTGDAK